MARRCTRIPATRPARSGAAAELVPVPVPAVPIRTSSAEAAVAGAAGVGARPPGRVPCRRPGRDVFSVAARRINTPGSSWRVRWVTVHDTAADGSAPFDANALAKAAGATPFRRPENGGYQPGSHFRSFVFAATGDTDAQAGQVPALAARGVMGRALSRASGRVGQPRPAVDRGARRRRSLASFDNVAFAGPRVLLTAEDRGNTLHQQLNMLDSVWGYRLGDPAAERFLALGRDRVSEADAAAGGDDNEPTGLTISNGRITRAGMLGTTASLDGARMFITQQHGRNRLWEIVRQP